jgi:hypothetical protein
MLSGVAVDSMLLGASITPVVKGVAQVYRVISKLPPMRA